MINEIKYLKTLLIPVIIALMIGCSGGKKDGTSDTGQRIKFKKCETNKGSYQAGEVVLGSIEITNVTSKAFTINNLKVVVKNISKDDEAVLNQISLAETIRLEPGEAQVYQEIPLWTIPVDAAKDAFGVFLNQTASDGTQKEDYCTFFRVVDDRMLTGFKIGIDNYKGLDVFTLDGGMSAEYVVEKSAECLAGGISHSWDVNAPGSGPNHVYGTPHFLENSINQTVDFYNEALGNEAVFETVIVSPGIPSVPYISNALKAPVLPLHFLVSVNAVKEVQSILDYSNANGYKSYSTLSHDPSVPYAVAWIKLLDLPRQYINFMKQHKVKNVVILGATGTEGGETKAKKIVTGTSSNGYQANDIFIMYPGTSSDDIVTLNEKIVDLKQFRQMEQFIRIADWESGIVSEQIENFSSRIKAETQVLKTAVVTADDLVDLYNLGTCITVACMHKNRDAYATGENPIKGVVFNPYLISHPVYEMKKGYIPVVYWQLIPPVWTLSRLEKDMRPIIDSYFPGTEYKALNYWVNSSNNFGGFHSAENYRKALIERGYQSIRKNDYTNDEVWNLSDGMQSISELVAKEISDSFTVESFQKWNRDLKPVSVDELEKLVDQIEGISITVKN
ncbi:hypothetical protein DMA11_17285 [Marinilabiliaceae bacterium JC017]|nr:hypothetical protein DMA11_17285 [Marinilabiliaceae bacterium JC017]